MSFASSRWRKCWTNVDYGQVVIPGMPCPNDPDDKGYHLCRKNLGHRGGGHECACGYTWNWEKV